MNKINKNSETAITLWVKTASLTRKMDASLASIHGIGFLEYIVLHRLKNAPGNAMRRIDLANAICRTASGVTRMLSPMEKIGLVEKADNPRDARVSLIKITKTGEEIYHDATNSLNEKSNQVMTHISEKQIEGITVSLDHMNL